MSSSQTFTAFLPYIYTSFNEEDVKMYIQSCMKCKIINICLSKTASKLIGCVVFDKHSLTKDVMRDINSDSGFWIYADNIGFDITKGQSKMLLVEYKGRMPMVLPVNGVSLRNNISIPKPKTFPERKPEVVISPLKTKSTWVSVVEGNHTPSRDVMTMSLTEEQTKNKVELLGSSTYVSYKTASDTQYSMKEMKLLMEKMSEEIISLKREVKSLREKKEPEHVSLDIGNLMSMTEETQNELLGNLLYELITARKQEFLNTYGITDGELFDVGKLVGMFLELEFYEKLSLVLNKPALDARVADALNVLSII